MKSTNGLAKRVARATRLADKKLRLEQPIEFVTFWGDEEVPDDGSPIFRTEWGGGILEDDEVEEDGMGV